MRNCAMVSASLFILIHALLALHYQCYIQLRAIAEYMAWLVALEADNRLPWRTEPTSSLATTETIALKAIERSWLLLLAASSVVTNLAYVLS
jgi:hypothetical protein